MGFITDKKFAVNIFNLTNVFSRFYTDFNLCARFKSDVVFITRKTDKKTLAVNVFGEVLTSCSIIFSTPLIYGTQSPFLSITKCSSSTPTAFELQPF